MDIKVFTVSSKAFFQHKLGLKADDTGKVSTREMSYMLRFYLPNKNQITYLFKMLQMVHRNPKAARRSEEYEQEN